MSHEMTDSVIVRDTGFSADDYNAEIRPLEDGLGDASFAVDLGPEADVAALAPYLAQLQMVRIAFPNFADGRGFTLARRLRLMGYTGRLRARGHVLADQYAMARRAGFDEVEISADLATRQPEDQWLFRADWQQNDYQARLRA